MERVLLLILRVIDSDALFRKKCEMGMFIQNRPAPMTQNPSLRVNPTCMVSSSVDLP